MLPLHLRATLHWLIELRWRENERPDKWPSHEKVNVTITHALSDEWVERGIFHPSTVHCEIGKWSFLTAAVYLESSAHLLTQYTLMYMMINISGRILPLRVNCGLKKRFHRTHSFCLLFSLSCVCIYTLDGQFTGYSGQLVFSWKCASP